ncbi:uncharacterized protein LOC125055685 [Pieris napi]|uniref:uncharacterized protein LOC125055685 n=1 Tax=Pieris napi TaxID=78633 RepID=UPI001FB86A91|nr:uncharacterized protein LOC125055685 [Pieris napi]
MWTAWLLLALAVTVQGRAVNISNTWVLPEEGFPVFYRYFRDRISWYEADAVCQFHHANLVTVDTTAQYDAVRAYLKELDISSAVWVGLIRSNPDGDFTWTDYRGLSGEGYWSSAPDSRTAPLCAAADPASDYRWDARACGGPSVASFICELPVPQWALGSEGCMLKALPALTVLYLPESAAVQLTTDCGLAGVRRVQCTGNVKREDLLKDLSCSEDDTSTTLWNVHFTGNDMETTTGLMFDGDSVTDENIMTEQQEIQQSTVKSSTTQTFNLVTQNVPSKQNQLNSMFDKVPDLNIIDNNNIYNHIPTGPYKTDFSSTEYANKLEDERHMHHKLLHDELARLGNFESIFNQATDHFVPPLVMAKAKLSNDMNAMSFEEKLAQEHEDYEEMTKHSNDMKLINKNNVVTTQVPQYKTTDKIIINTQDLIHENKDKEITKKIVPKKYFSKETKPLDVKRKSLPVMNLKASLDDEINITPTSSITTLNTKVITPKYDVQNNTDNDEKDETSIELTVIIREPTTNLKDIEISNGTDMITKYSHQVFNSSVTYNDLSEHTVLITKPNSTNVGNVEIIQEINSLNDSFVESNASTTDTTHRSYEVLSTSEPYKNDFNREVIQTEAKINIVSGKSKHVVESKLSQILDLEKSTEQPIFKDDIEKNNVTTESFLDIISHVTSFDSNNSNVLINQTNHMYINNMVTSSPESNMTENHDNPNNSLHNNDPLVSEVFVINVTQDEIPNIIINGNITEIIEPSENLESNIELHLSSNSSEEEIDDFQSPLLSGADDSEIHKPMRRRIPNVQNRGKKFNPFRILG